MCVDVWPVGLWNGYLKINIEQLPAASSQRKNNTYTNTHTLGRKEKHQKLQLSKNKTPFGAATDYGRSCTISAYLDVPDDHGVSIRVEKVLALGIGAQHNGLAPLGARQGCVDIFWKGSRHIRRLDKEPTADNAKESWKQKKWVRHRPFFYGSGAPAPTNCPIEQWVPIYGHNLGASGGGLSFYRFRLLTHPLLSFLLFSLQCSL